MDAIETTGKPTPNTKKSVSVGVTPDKMHVVVSIRKKPEDLPASVKYIEGALKKLGVAKPLDGTEISRWLSDSLNQEGLISDGLLMSGIDPVYPVDGRIEWGGDYFSMGFQIDPETGAIDYRKRKGQSSVGEGELLATIIPGFPGTDGKTIFGDKIAVGKPKAAKLGVGKNVRREESDNTFFAEMAGRVELVNGKLSVSDVYVISGDVGLESGNIDHPGAIIVEQDILEGSNVRASGDIEIHGIVEAANIYTDGNLYVYGGICGKEGVSIYAAGEIHAMYILDSKVESGGNILVAREIVHSEVNSLGAVKVPDGRIIGGTTTALGGIELGEAGSDACVETILIPGVDYRSDGRREAQVEELASLQEQRTKIMESLKPLLPLVDSLPAEKRAMVVKLAENANTLRASADALEREMDGAKEAMEEYAKHTIRVRTNLFSEVKVCIKQEWHKFKHSVSGPLRIECVGEKIRAKSEK